MMRSCASGPARCWASKQPFAGLREGGLDGYVAYEVGSPLRGAEASLGRAATKSLAKIRLLIS